FTGKTALITGGSRGIGKQVAEHFAKEGANIAVIDVNQEALDEAAKDFTDKGYKFVIKQSNVAEAEEVEEVVKEIVCKIVSIGIFFNTAGITRDNIIFKMTDDKWDDVMKVHLNGSFNAARAVQKYMVENKSGRIINLSSTSAQGNRGQVNYSTAKAGLQGF